jgi:hypothetical protein
VDDKDFARIAAEIESDSSPVGIDAKKTHIMILLALERLEQRLQRLEQRLEQSPESGDQGR